MDLPDLLFPTDSLAPTPASLAYSAVPFARNKRGILYIRVSSPHQEQGYSPQFQRRDGETLATKLGITLTHTLYEQASGARSDREAFQELLRLVDRGDDGNILSWDLDRISRNMRDGVDFLDRCKARNVTLYDTKTGQPMDLEHAMMFARFRLVIAEEERERIRKRMRAGQRQRSLEGHPPCQVPYGYTYVRNHADKTDKGKWEPIPEQVQIVREIFARYIMGESPQQIADRLNARGVLYPPSDRYPRKKNLHNNWLKENVWYVLTTEDYTGKKTTHTGTRRPLQVKHGTPPKTWRGQRQKTEHVDNPPEDWIIVTVPAIVSPEDFEAARVVRENKQNGRPMARKIPALLRGVLFCSVDGYTMTPVVSPRKSGAMQTYYRCGRRQSGDHQHRYAPGETQHPWNCLPVQWLDAIVWDMLVSIFQPGSLIPNALRALTDPRIHDTALQEADAAIAHWTAQVADFTAGQNRLEAILAREDVLDIDTILIKRNEMVSKKRQAEVALTRATQGRKALLVAETAHLHEWETLCHQWPSRWDVLSFEEKRELLVSLGPSFRVVYHHGSSRVSKIYNRKPADRTLPLLEIWGHLPFEAPLAFRLTAEMVEFYPTRTFTPGDPLPPPCATPQHRPEQTVAMLFVDTAECPLPAPNRSDG